MTTDISHDLDVPMRELTVRQPMAVIAEHDLGDVALMALLEDFGHRVSIIDVDAEADMLPPCPVAAVIVRSERRLARLSELGWFRDSRIIGIGVRPDPSTGVGLPDSAFSAGVLRQVLEKIAPSRTRRRVRLSDRECEVVLTYVLGATVRQTAAQHYIAESTVRTHLRRDTERYVEAGHQVSNKSQLLIELMADGWIDRNQLLRR